MWHYDLMRRWKMRYMMKQVFLVILLAFGFVAGAQNVPVRKPKKQKPATTHVAPKKQKQSPVTQKKHKDFHAENKKKDKKKEKQGEKEKTEKKSSPALSKYKSSSAQWSSSEITSVRREDAAGYDVTFSCNVPSALLSIDGVPNGTASGTRFLKTGNHSIKVTADNYVDYTGTFAVNSSSRSVSVNLQEVPVRFSDGVLTIKGVSYEMVWVEGGTFRMGATSEQGKDASSDEKPVHNVTLSGFYIGKTEVTQALWKMVMDSNPSEFRGDNLPVENVSWDDCQEFIWKLRHLTGQNFRFPTEAEWEFACRGGNNSRGYKYSGSNYIDNVAWYNGNSGFKTHPVATKSPNELGIYDMSGNVWEWCSDWYHYKYSRGAQTNPEGPSKGWDRVCRGGSWYSDINASRLSRRHNDRTYKTDKRLGLRLAL